MYRRVQVGALTTVRGVLNDMDLSSYRRDLDARTATSLHRTGTPPFMAHELLNPKGDVKHLYRHDLESLFCVMLVLVSRHRLPIGPLLPPATPPQPPPRCILDLPHSVAPFNAWFDGNASWNTLYVIKSNLFNITQDVDEAPYNQVHETFKGFVVWIKRLWKLFRQGFSARVAYNDSLESSDAETVPLPATGFIEPDVKPMLPAPTTFDNETLDGYVTYDSFLRVMYSFNNVALIVSYTTEERNVART